MASLLVASPAIAAMLYVSFRMTFYAPRHLQCRNTGYAVHRFYGSVTLLTLEARSNVPLMREVHKVGYVVHFNPWNRLTIFPEGRQRQNLRIFADAGYGVVTSHAFTNAGYAGNRRRVGIDVAVLARNFVVRGMYLVTEFDWLNGSAIGEILAVYPCADKQSEHEYKHEQGWLLRGPKRIENRDRQWVPLLLGQEFARKLRKLQIQCRLCHRYVSSMVSATRFSQPESRRHSTVSRACAAAVTSVGLATLSMP